MKRKRLVRGKDWHAWVWKRTTDKRLFYWAEPDRLYHSPDLQEGKWVRVRFVEVKSR